MKAQILLLDIYTEKQPSANYAQRWEKKNKCN
jgi:hypothetical protein